MSPALQIINISKADSSAGMVMAKLHQSAFAKQDERGWSADDFSQLLGSYGVSVWLAKLGDEPLGFILVRVVAGEAELVTLAVSPHAQGRGVARALLMHCSEKLRAAGCGNFFLEVREDNARALKLYDTAGFIQIGERPNYYLTKGGKRIDALCLALSLNTEQS